MCPSSGKYVNGLRSRRRRRLDVTGVELKCSSVVVLMSLLQPLPLADDASFSIITIDYTENAYNT